MHVEKFKWNQQFQEIYDEMMTDGGAHIDTIISCLRRISVSGSPKSSSHYGI